MKNNLFTRLIAVPLLALAMGCSASNSLESYLKRRVEVSKVREAVKIVDLASLSPEESTFLDKNYSGGEEISSKEFSEKFGINYKDCYGLFGKDVDRKEAVGFRRYLSPMPAGFVFNPIR